MAWFHGAAFYLLSAFSDTKGPQIKASVTTDVSFSPSILLGSRSKELPRTYCLRGLYLLSFVFRLRMVRLFLSFLFGYSSAYLIYIFLCCFFPHFLLVANRYVMFLPLLFVVVW